jgi:YjbE family integral membrane protein
VDLLSPQFWSALFAIVVIDLVLAGDNAIVIALAARRLPAELRNKAIVWGTVGAIAVRAAMSLAVVALLKVPGLLAAGGLLLVWIAYKLLAPGHEPDEQVAARPQITGFWAAIRTIVIADTIMGLDNVLGVAGAAQGSFLLVILGLLLSVPIMVWGSSLILRMVDRYPAIIYVGAGVLAWTAAVMLVNEPLLEERIASRPWLPWAVYALLTGGVLLAGFLRNRARPERAASSDAAGS